MGSSAEALPYLRIMFAFSFGMLMFFMLGRALRSAGDARTPLRLGIVLTVLNVVLYLFDAGVFRSLRPRRPLDRPEEISGAALEGLVAQHLRAWIEYTGRDFEVYTWRTRSNVEIDFVVYGPDGFWTLEVKNARTVRPADLRGLQSFREDYPECRPLLLHRGDDRFVRDAIPCVPVQAFLEALRPGKELDGMEDRG